MKEIIYGLKPVLESLRAGRRKFYSLYISRSERNKFLEQLLKLAKERNVPVLDSERKKLENLTGTKEHQGVCAVVSPFPEESEEKLLKIAGSLKRVLFLPHIEDPRNMGAIIRTCVAFDFKHIVLSHKNCAPSSPLALKASAGAMEWSRIFRVKNAGEVIEIFKSEGFTIIAGDINGSYFPEEINAQKCCVMFGSEEKGLPPFLLKKADLIVRIPMESEMDSLNISVACGIILYHIYKKSRGYERKGEN